MINKLEEIWKIYQVSLIYKGLFEDNNAIKKIKDVFGQKCKRLENSLFQ
jgi:hypothetical protein